MSTPRAGKSEDLAYLESFPGMSYHVYLFSAGKLYLFGNDESLKLIAFGGETGNIPLRKGITSSIAATVRFLDAYFRKRPAPLPAVDLGSYTAHERSVYRALLKVPFGSTISYGKLAHRAGIPRGARFAGNAMAKNRYPILIPCHRVIRGDGSMGNYSSGTAIKRFLLLHEGVDLK